MERLRAKPAELERCLADLGDVPVRLECGPFPVVAAVDGYAVADGLKLLLACDAVVATTDAYISDGLVKYGLAPWLETRSGCRVDSRMQSHITCRYRKSSQQASRLLPGDLRG